MSGDPRVPSAFRTPTAGEAGPDAGTSLTFLLRAWVWPTPEDQWVLVALGGERVPWLVSPAWAMPAIALVATWKNVGLYVLLFLAGLQNIPAPLYEAAEVEGASRWQTWWHVTLPMLNPHLVTVVVLSTIGGFSLFVEPYVLTGGGPLNSTLSGLLYIYNQAFTFNHMGYAATLGLAFALLILVVVLIQRRVVEAEAT